jgi:hypothetical protein
VSATTSPTRRTRTHTPPPAEELELAALCGIAWERRDDPEQLRAAIEAIVDWHDRRFVRAWERRQRELAALVLLLRETDPARSRRRQAA